ncbi:MAG TPA: alkaline phosphatase family protein [Candidatus Dormibacteraeota bacterium]|nr:alkaline phosphatase family protein [Candidatus Dormibacteraeota bacterium]
MGWPFTTQCDSKEILAWPVVIALCVAGSLAPSTVAQTRQTYQTRTEPSERDARHDSAQRPKLIVLLVVDQFRADYVDKFRHQWSGGLKRLIEHGAWFREAAYPYANTFTCVGHATISTGVLPSTHGIMGNAWYDRETDKQVTCTSDPNVQGVGYGPAPKTGDSPVRLKVPTLADELRVQSGESTRVTTFSLKARSAIMLAGHRADAVTWHDNLIGTWVSSSVYGTSPLVAQFVKAHPIEKDFNKTWALTLPAPQYLYEQATEGRGGTREWRTGFPHALHSAADPAAKPDAEFYQRWEVSPFADDYLAQMAESVADGLKLGQGRGSDFLGISFSTLDLAGHAYGPRSREVQDVLVRLDRTLGEFLAHLDSTVGRANYVVALTADHGVAPLPIEMQKAGFDAGWISSTEVIDKIAKTLAASGHVTAAEAESKPGLMIDGDVWLKAGLYERLKQDAKALRGVIDAIAAMPGVARVFRGDELIGQQSNSDRLVRSAAASYVPGRSGDLIILPRPYWIFGGNGSTGTSHGSPYDYDQRVPVILMGGGIKPGEYLVETTPADIAPTLAFLCGITLARPDGRVLREALVTANGARPIGRIPAAKN